MKFNFDKAYSKIGFVFMLGAMLKMHAAFVIANGVKISFEGDHLIWLFEFLCGLAVFVAFGNRQAG